MKSYIFKYKFLFLFTTLLTIIYAALNVAVAWMLQLVIDSATSAKSLNTLINSVIFFAIYISIAFCVEIALKTFKSIYIQKTLSYMRNVMVNNIFNKDISDFTKRNSAQYISILSNDISLLEQDYILSIFNIINNITTFTLALISLIYINISITIIILVLSASTLIIPNLFSKELSKRKLLYSNIMELFTIKIKDLLSGFEVIKNFNVENKVKKEFELVNDNLELAKRNYSIYNSIIDSFAELLGTIMFLAPILFGGYLVFKKQITVGILIALIQLMNSISSPLITSIHYLNKFKSSKEIINKIKEFLLTNPVKSTESLLPINNIIDSIKFNNVSFSYNNEYLTLNNLNIEFKKGKKYAIVGESGSGKSTILKLLLKYYDKFSGDITIDNQSINNISTNNLYRLISIIHQNIFMFSGNIKDNITLYNDYTDEDVLKIIKKSGLDKLINKLPNGIYTNIGEDGNTLSGGEKQRIAIARALIKNTEILLLDESTSALDNITAFELEQTILSINDLTALVVTHKLNEENLKKYDTIYVLKNGNLIESGDFYTLLENKNYFYSLYTLNNEETLSLSNIAE